MINPYTNVWKDVVRAYFKDAPLVPVLSANTGQGVTVSASSENTSNQKAYNAFDGDDTTKWVSKYESTCYLLIKFDNPKIATRFNIMTMGGKSNSGTFKIQGSKNRTTFTDLVNSFSHSSVLQTFKAINKEQYNYYRVYITGATTDINNGITPGIITFQIYGSEVV